jgi:GTPase SAR1 family protein
MSKKQVKTIEQEEIKYKLIVIGDENIGKKSILNRFKNNKFRIIN